MTSLERLIHNLLRCKQNLYRRQLLYQKINTTNIMEEELNSAYPENTGKSEESAELSDLKEKVNVDQAAIDEARAAVGDDEDKIKEYLINNRGL